MTTAQLVRTLGVLSAALLAGAAAVAAEPTPEDILRARGLERSGVYFITAAEAEVFDALLKVKPYLVRMATAGDKVRYQYQLGVLAEQLNDELIATQSQAIEIRQAINAARPRNPLDRQQLAAMRATLADVQAYGRQVNANLSSVQAKRVGPAALGKLEKDFEKERDAFLQAVAEFRPVYDKMMEGYDQLKQDSSVSNALVAYGGLNKFRAKLGPSDRMVKNIGIVKNAERFYSPETAAPPTGAKAKARAKSKGRSGPSFAMPKAPGSSGLADLDLSRP